MKSPMLAIAVLGYAPTTPQSFPPLGHPIMPTPRQLPPLGIKPRKFWLEERQTELLNAIARRVGTGFPILEEWLMELLDISLELNDQINQARPLVHPEGHTA